MRDRPPAAADDRAQRHGQPAHLDDPVSGFFEPLFYLLSIRVGFGELVGDVRSAGRRVSVREFVAPALMAASAMNGAVYDATMNVFHKLQVRAGLRRRAGDADAAGDVALGEIGFGADPRHAVLDRVPRRRWGARHGRLAVGDVVAAGRAP